MSVVTAMTANNKRRPRRTAARPKGNAAIGAVSGGLFGANRRGRVSEMQRLSENLYRATRIGRLAAAA